MTSFGSLIRSYRLRAGLGLRTFATLIDQRASIVSAIESHRRAPWRRAATLQRVADVLGLAESSSLWQKIVELAHSPFETCSATDRLARAVDTSPMSASLAWWWRSEDSPELDNATLAELAKFVGASVNLVDGDLNTGRIPHGPRPGGEEPARDADLSAAQPAHGMARDAQIPPLDKPLPVLTELAIEWRVRQLLGRREALVVGAPVDVEVALENDAGVYLEIVPGLIPRFSVEACAVQTPSGMTFFVDRIVADSRPISAYRHLLALSFAPAALWHTEFPKDAPHGWLAARFQRLQADLSWPQRLRDCERFALAMLLPANPVLAAAESAYGELVQQQGWLAVDEAARALRNRLAEQFAVPPALVHRRLVGWPCHLYGRIGQALAAQEPTLPPLDWLVDSVPPRQQTLFDLEAGAKS